MWGVLSQLNRHNGNSTPWTSRHFPSLGLRVPTYETEITVLQGVGRKGQTGDSTQVQMGRKTLLLTAPTPTVIPSQGLRDCDIFPPAKMKVFYFP